MPRFDLRQINLSQALSIHGLTRHHWLAIGGFIVLCLILQSAGLQDVLAYDRVDIAQGQWWRVVTWPYVYMSYSHLGFDTAGILLNMVLVGMVLRVREWGLLLLFSTLVMSAGLWLLSPEVQWCVGISGAACTILAVGAPMLWFKRPNERIVAVLIFLALIGKLAYEHGYGPMPGSVEESGGPVLVQCHLYGAVAGVIWLVLRRLWTRPDRQAVDAAKAEV